MTALPNHVGTFINELRGAPTTGNYVTSHSALMPGVKEGHVHVWDG